MIPIAIAVIAAAYQIVALLACVFRRGQRPGASGQSGTRHWRSANAANAWPVSILKPVHGADPALREAIRSHTVFHGEYELLCGASDPADPAITLLAEMTREFPVVRLVECRTKMANAKAGVLSDLAAAARFPVVIVNDADIRVEQDYLNRVTAPLADPAVGVVTCLYRPMGATFASRFEGLGVSTDFAPSALVARLVGVDEFAMGSTLAFRRADLDRIGGFSAFGDYLADDYQLGHRIHALGLKCVLSDTVVETSLSGSWLDVWRHQVRWARTIRVSKPGGYIGLPITNGTLWAVILAGLGRWDLAAVVLAIRLWMALQAGWFVLRSRDVLKLWWLVPARDFFAFAVWITGLFGNTVVWRGSKLKLDREGRIL
ncbi:MAG TPA: glycosyltransferase [Bryobacteraceae bacterium]|nr:glycosyltransferase [Bryobacteraceae bacterium]